MLFKLAAAVGLSLILSACGSNGSSAAVADGARAESNLPVGGATQHGAMVGKQGVQPYRVDGPHAQYLRRCALAEHADSSCTFSQLPLVAMEHVYPSVDDIMSRVLVSHQWMGRRFEQMLRELPADVRVLMGSVTAIVIAEDIRPSYYWSLTGAVYIDAYHLWLTPEERSTFAGLEIVSGNDKSGSLAFHAWWRYVKDNDFAYRMWGDWDAVERDFDSTTLPMAATLFHELAHANDYFPPDQIQTLDPSLTVAQAREQLQQRRASEALYEVAPLSSKVMFRLAGAIHRQAPLAAEDARLRAEDVGLAFQMGLASDDYAYISRFEDVAMLFEETMMLRHFGVHRDVAYLHRAATQEQPQCDDYVVGWGMRNRIADSAVLPRARQVAEAIMPSRQWREFFADLAPPRFLSFGRGWCQSLIVGNDAAAAAAPTHPSLSDFGFTQQRLYQAQH